MGLRWFFTNRGRKFFFAQTFLDDSPTFLVVVKRPETSLFFLVFHLRVKFGDIWNSKFLQFLRIAHLLRRIFQKVGKQRARKFHTFLTIIFPRCWVIMDERKLFKALQNFFDFWNLHIFDQLFKFKILPTMAYYNTAIHLAEKKSSWAFWGHPEPNQWLSGLPGYK